MAVKSCETIRIVIFSWWHKSSNNFRREFLEGGCTPTRGSSRSRKSASDANALAIIVRWSSPPDSLDISESALSTRPTISNALSTLRFMLEPPKTDKLREFRVPNLTISLTVIRMWLGIFEPACGTHPILPWSDLEKPSFPYNLTSPPVLGIGSSNPRIVRRSVVFPLPLGPTNPTNSPFMTSRFISWITSCPERATDRSLICRTGVTDPRLSAAALNSIFRRPTFRVWRYLSIPERKIPPRPSSSLSHF